MLGNNQATLLLSSYNGHRTLNIDQLKTVIRLNDFPTPTDIFRLLPLIHSVRCQLLAVDLLCNGTGSQLMDVISHTIIALLD